MDGMHHDMNKPDWGVIVLALIGVGLYAFGFSQGVGFAANPPPLAEVAAYDRQLTDAEREEVTTRLMAQVSSGPALVGCYNAREELCEPCGKR